MYPDTRGNGLAMRAGMFVEALAQTYRVSLLVVPIFTSRGASSDTFIRRHCAEEFIVEPRLDGSPRLKRRDADRTQPALLRFFAYQTEACIAAIGSARFDVIHAMRLYSGPLALALGRRAPAQQRPQIHLDVDDVESVTHTRLAELFRLHLSPAKAEQEQQEAAAYAEAERKLLPLFDRLYVCSESDAAALAPLAPREVRVVPNAVRPPEPLPERLTSHPFRFLFVGSLNYFPNEDAVRYFCTEVVPLLRRRAAAPFQVRIVGTGLSDALMPLTRIPEVRLIGKVDDLAAEYGDADAVIVPIRAGGGTRIKVLEAFAYQRPVVATTIGVEGIDAAPGADVLIGNTPAELAAQCLHLMEDASLGAALTRHAASLVEQRYSQAAINRLLAGWAEPPPRQGSRSAAPPPSPR